MSPIKFESSKFISVKQLFEISASGDEKTAFLIESRHSDSDEMEFNDLHEIGS